jgi:hypothetical protein
MSGNFDDEKKNSDLNSGGQNNKNTKKMRSTYTETEEIEDIETTTIFKHFKKNGVILRIDNALYLLWDQRYRDQDFVRNKQNHDL